MTGSLENVTLLTGSDLHGVVIEETLARCPLPRVDRDSGSEGTCTYAAAAVFKPILEFIRRHGLRAASASGSYHSALPSRYFRRTLEEYPNLTDGALETAGLPPVALENSHRRWKVRVLRIRQFHRRRDWVRNLPTRETWRSGLCRKRASWVLQLERLFDTFWIGEYCDSCRLRNECPDPVPVTARRPPPFPTQAGSSASSLTYRPCSRIISSAFFSIMLRATAAST